MTTATMTRSERDTLKWRLDFRLDELAAIAGGLVLRGDPMTMVAGLVHDTREQVAGAMFVALRGENFDGHDFLRVAVDAGAVGAMISQDADLADLPPDFFIVRVTDTLAALGRLGAARRMRHAIPVVAVAGSSGKTTTKDMIAHLLSARYRTHRTPGNWNNLVGLPLSLLSLRPEHEVAVLEVGMNQPGELKILTRLAAPSAGVLTNVGVAHLGMFGNEMELLSAKGEFVDALPSGARLYVNADCQRSAVIVKRFAGLRPVTRVGEMGDSDARILQYEPADTGYRFLMTLGDDRLEARLPCFGRFNIWNAALAAAVAHDFGLDPGEIAHGLLSFQPNALRAQRETVGGVTLVVDCYNANPDSMFAALESFAETPVSGRRLALLGDMLELGDAALSFHERVGRHFGVERLERLVTFGEQARAIGRQAADAGVDVVHAEAIEDAAAALLETARPGDAILFKGSRGMRLERAVAIARERLAEHAGDSPPDGGGATS